MLPLLAGADVVGGRVKVGHVLNGVELGDAQDGVAGLQQVRAGGQVALEAPVAAGEGALCRRDGLVRRVGQRGRVRGLCDAGARRLAHDGPGQRRGQREEARVAQQVRRRRQALAAEGHGDATAAKRRQWRRGRSAVCGRGGGRGGLVK